jgi:hypothetical protein
MMFRRLQKQLHDTELGTGSGTTGTRTCTYELGTGEPQAHVRVRMHRYSGATRGPKNRLLSSPPSHNLQRKRR